MNNLPCLQECEHFTCACLKLEAAWGVLVRELLKAVEPVVVPLLDWLTKFLSRFASRPDAKPEAGGLP